MILTDKTISKRFPADTGLDYLTFLNDKNINGELYAYLQQISMGLKDDKGNHYTIVYKDKFPKQSIMCEKLGIKSPKTLRAHLNYLIEKGYVILTEEGNYILPEMESMFFYIPLDTIQYLKDNCREHIFKIYIYLGQRYKYALSQGRQYEFNLEELGNHIGIRVKNNTRGYSIVNNALDLLCNSGLIDYCEYFNGQQQKKKLTKFSFDYIKK